MVADWTTVTPSLVKYSVDSLDDNGKTVGTLGAFNTIGSIIRTFVPTFVTIPAVGTSITFLIFSGILLALSIVYFVSEKTGKKKVIVSGLIFILCCGLGYSDSFAFWENNLTYEGESVYNYLQVYENDERVAAWSKSLDTFSNFVPNFATIVSSMQINTGCDFKSSGIRCRAILAVTFINPK